MGSILPFVSPSVTGSYKPSVSDSVDGTRVDSNSLGHTAIETAADIGRISSKKIDISELYPLSSELRPELSTAFALLDEGLHDVSVAIEMQNIGDMISSDDAINRLQALLPELFCCRSLGDGFGSIISAIYQSITNMHGNPLNAKQLSALQVVLKRVQSEPFLEFNEAVDEIMALEDAGFEVEPSYYAYAADMLDD